MLEHGIEMDAQAIHQWLTVLDSVSHYDLFGIPQTATYDELRVAFHSFAETFHPDVHKWRSPEEQTALGSIFRRGTEAYRVLSDPALRARYDQALAAGILRPEELIVESEGSRSMKGAGPSASGRLSDRVRNPGARPFALRLEELVEKGDPKQAKIQLVMAMHMDPKNPALEQFAKELDEQIKAKDEDEDEKKKARKKP